MFGGLQSVVSTDPGEVRSLRTRTATLPAPSLSGVWVRERVRLEIGLLSRCLSPLPFTPLPPCLQTPRVSRTAEPGTGVERRLNQVLILVPARFPREELSPNLVTVISFRFKQ